MDCLYGKWKYKIIKSTFSYYRIDHIILALPLYGGIHTWNKSHHMHLSVRVVVVTKSRRSRPPFVDSNLLQASLDDVYFKSENRQDGIMFQTINISFMCILRLKLYDWSCPSQEIMSNWLTYLFAVASMLLLSIEFVFEKAYMRCQDLSSHCTKSL